MKYSETLVLAETMIEKCRDAGEDPTFFFELKREVLKCERLRHLDPKDREETLGDLDERVRIVYKSLSSQNKFVESLEGDEAPVGTTDPNGLDAHAPGAKLDQGKLRAGLVLADFSNALEQVVKIGSDGAKKYTDHGWLEVPDGVTRYTDAFYRHLLAHNQGESLDPESGSPHLSHAAWNLLAVIELMVRERNSEKSDSLSEEQA